MPRSYKDYIDSLKRVTGVSTPIFGVQWHPKEPERARVRRIIAFCEDRRILFAPHNWEMPEDCIKSAVAIRSFLTTELGEISPESELGERLTLMRKACRTFLDSSRRGEGGPGGWEGNYGHSAHEPFRRALDKLREVFGQHVFWLMMTHGLTVEDELARIFPSHLTGESPNAQ